MIALIDMDLVCYRCAASAENEDFDITVFRMNDLLDNILTSVGATAYKAYLSGEDNFRKQIYPEYKANRTQEKPRHLEAAKEYAISDFNAEAEYSLEADDLLGINQTSETIICSLDKDLLQIPGKHFKWEMNTPQYSKPSEFINQTEVEGLRLFYEQCLKGDRSDNVKGINKIGEVKARNFLKDCTNELDMFRVVKDLYGNDDEFLMNAACLWILREDREPYSVRFERLNVTL